MLHTVEIKYQHCSLGRKIRVLDAARSSLPIMLKTCSVHLSDFLLKLMVSALRSVFNGSSGEVSKTTVLISRPVTQHTGKLGFQITLYCNAVPSGSRVLWALHQLPAQEEGERGIGSGRESRES